MRRQDFRDLPELIGLVRLDREQITTTSGNDTQTPFALAARRFAGANGAVGNCPHGFNGAEDRFLVDQRPTVLAQPLQRQAVRSR